MGGFELDMPGEFPMAPFMAVQERVASYVDSHNHAFRQYAAAWNGIAWRMRAAAEHADNLEEHLAAVPASKVSVLDRYLEERDLYGFFVNGVSAIDIYFYCVHAMAAILMPDDFPIATDDQMRGVIPVRVGERFWTTYPNDLITAAMVGVLSSVDWAEWTAIRNLLGHRGSPGRDAYVGGVFDGQVQWAKGIPIEPGMTREPRKWLSVAMYLLLDGAARFAADRL